MPPSGSHTDIAQERVAVVAAPHGQQAALLGASATCQYCSAIFRATSTDTEPESLKKTRSSGSGVMLDEPLGEGDGRLVGEPAEHDVGEPVELLVQPPPPAPGAGSRGSPPTTTTSRRPARAPRRGLDAQPDAVRRPHDQRRHGGGDRGVRVPHVLAVVGGDIDRGEHRRRLPRPSRHPPGTAHGGPCDRSKGSEGVRDPVRDALWFHSHADVAQLVEHHLAKVRVAGSNPVVRSTGTPGFSQGFLAVYLRFRAGVGPGRQCLRPTPSRVVTRRTAPFCVPVVSQLVSHARGARVRPAPPVRDVRFVARLPPRSDVQPIPPWRPATSGCHPDASANSD